jgi:hypothetical protein
MVARKRSNCLFEVIMDKSNMPNKNSLTPIQESRAKSADFYAKSTTACAMKFCQPSYLFVK